MSKMLPRICLGLFSCLCILGCEDQPAGAPGGAANEIDNSDVVAKVEKHGDEAIASGKKAEAREWLKSDSHVLFKASRKKLARFVEDFYAAGAKEVLIVDTEEHEGKEFGGALLIVLPAESAARGKVFEVGKQADEAYGEDSVADQGQKYLYYGLE